MIRCPKKRDIKNLISKGLVLALTSGASFIIGVLSFAGFFALWPVASVAMGALILSVAYEGEIYFQNITSALHKLFQPNHIKLDLALRYLHDYFPRSPCREEWPAFFRQYELALQRRHRLNHPLSNSKAVTKKRLMDKKLKMMEHYFAKQLDRLCSINDLFLPKDHESLLHYLMLHPSLGDHGVLATESIVNQYHYALVARRRAFFWVRLFSLVMVFVMGFGTSYLLGATLPYFKAFPIGSFSSQIGLILPLTSISGLAYGLLIYNTITNIITHDTLRSWYVKLNIEFGLKGFTLRNFILIVSAILLISFSLVLTCLTAGAWWAIIKRSKPVFLWMRKVPKWILGGVLPLLISLSSLIFNLENTNESLDMLNKMTRDKHVSIKHALLMFFHELRALWRRENVVQLLNPFRLILAFSITPLRILFFFGHVLSIGITTPRAQGAPKIWQVVFGIISKGFVDAHYFMDEKAYIQPETAVLLSERLGYNPRRRHEIDMPTKIMIYAAFPFYFLAVVWDYLFSQFNQAERRLCFTPAFQKQWVLHKVHKKTDYSLIGDYLNTPRSFPHYGRYHRYGKVENG